MFVQERMKRRRRDSSTNFNNSKGISIVSLGLILLIVSETCTSSTAEEDLRRWSPARKARFSSYTTAASPSRRGVGSELGLGSNYSDHESTSSTRAAASSDYEEDKRVVHTGPNPLHN